MICTSVMQNCTQQAWTPTLALFRSLLLAQSALGNLNSRPRATAYPVRPTRLAMTTRSSSTSTGLAMCA